LLETQENEMNFRPIGNRALVRRDKNDETTPGGIVIPENAKEKLTRGEVIAVGPGILENGKRVEPLIKRGDKIVFGKYSGQEVTLDGDELIIMPEEEIYGVIEG
jgi:chaperonin GroES